MVQLPLDAYWVRAVFGASEVGHIDKTWWYIFERKKPMRSVHCYMHLFCCKMLTCQCIYFPQRTVIIPSVSHITGYHNGTYDNNSYLGIIPDQLALQHIVANLLDLFAFVHQKNWLCRTCQEMPLCLLVSTTCLAFPYKCWNWTYILETVCYLVCPGHTREARLPHSQCSITGYIFIDCGETKVAKWNFLENHICDE
jgi:hypothetical protein